MGCSIYYDDVKECWVARFDGKEIELPVTCAWSDGNAIDAAAEATGVDAESVEVELPWI